MQQGIARPELRPEHSLTASSGAMTGARSSRDAKAAGTPFRVQA
jgi:hypothetical protein